MRRPLAALAAAAILLNTFAVGQPDWLINIFQNSDLTSWIVLAGMICSACLLLGLALYQFYKAFLPEIANRALFWVLDSIPPWGDEIAAIVLIVFGIVLVEQRMPVRDRRVALDPHQPIHSVRTLEDLRGAVFAFTDPIAQEG